MEEKIGRVPHPQSAADAQAEARTRRATALIASMPNVTPEATQAWIAWALVVVRLYSKRQLARVIPPWSRYIAPSRTPRGRLSNPTARA